MECNEQHVKGGFIIREALWKTAPILRKDTAPINSKTLRRYRHFSADTPQAVETTERGKLNPRKYPATGFTKENRDPR